MDIDKFISKASQGDRSSLESLLMHFHDPLLQFIRATSMEAPAAGITAEYVLQVMAGAFGSPVYEVRADHRRGD